MTRSTLLTLASLCIVIQIKASTLEGLADVGTKIAALAEQQSKRYVRIVNTMGPDVEVTADCASGDDTIKTQKLADGKDFAWMFKPHLFGRTLFWCDVKTSNGKSKHWDVYKGKERSQNWFIRGDGIYQGDVNGNGLLKKESW